MSNKNSDNGFAEILIPGSDGDGKLGGQSIPPAGSSRYVGKGAYSRSAKNKKAEEELMFSYDPGLVFVKNVQVFTASTEKDTAVSGDEVAATMTIHLTSEKGDESAS